MAKQFCSYFRYQKLAFHLRLVTSKIVRWRRLHYWFRRHRWWRPARVVRHRSANYLAVYHRMSLQLYNYIRLILYDNNESKVSKHVQDKTESKLAQNCANRFMHFKGSKNSVVPLDFYKQTRKIRFVELGICSIADSIMTDTVI